MATHTCPICTRAHDVNAVRAAFAYGRQLTCSPECEGERRRRMRRPAEGHHGAPDVAPRRSAWTPRSPEVARVLQAWVMARAGADLARTYDARRRAARRR